MKVSALERIRTTYRPKLPIALRRGANVKTHFGANTTAVADIDKIKKLFPNTYGSPVITFDPMDSRIPAAESKPISVGVILSGGQAPGGHNVIAGIYDGLKSINPKNRIFGIKNGPDGLIKDNVVLLDYEIIDAHRNTGGFDMIGSGRTKLESEEQFMKGYETCKAHDISALVIIGGDDSNTNACLLGEYYKSKNIPIQVLGCPKTIDGDLKNEWIEASFGFDTACRVYSGIIGNIARDAASSKKYWHFIKLMGRSASHIALECGLQTQPNITLISEEIEAKSMTLHDIVQYIASSVIMRADNGENFGVVLVPEGLIEFIPEIKVLINELNEILAKNIEAFNKITDESDKVAFVKTKLSKALAPVFSSLPSDIQKQLCSDRDPHGNVVVSSIDTERMLGDMVKAYVRTLSNFKGKFAYQTQFFGYGGRCAAPSNFDADYCYSLGYNASALIKAGVTGYMSSIRNITLPADKWIAGGIPITMLMNMERRNGKDKPVIKKALVELDGPAFKYFEARREEFMIKTMYVYPGPIQYFGPSDVCDLVAITLILEQEV